MSKNRSNLVAKAYFCATLLIHLAGESVFGFKLLLVRVDKYKTSTKTERYSCHLKGESEQKGKAVLTLHPSQEVTP